MKPQLTSIIVFWGFHFYKQYFLYTSNRKIIHEIKKNIYVLDNSKLVTLQNL